MGLIVSKLVDKLQEMTSSPTKILMIGLDAAGKTSVLYKLKLNELVTTIPTIGFNVEHVQYRSLDMTIWDVGGQDKIRPLWKHYYENADAIIYVIDSNDPDRIEEAAAELHKILADDMLRNARLLVLANKQDLPRAARPDAVASQLRLHSLRQHDWYLQPCSALSGDGIYEGLDWVHRSLKARNKGRGAVAAGA